MFKISDEFSSLVFVCWFVWYFLPRRTKTVHLYPIKFLTLNTTTVTKAMKYCQRLTPSSNIHMCIIYTKFKYLIGR